jgi:ferredoxin
MKDAKPAGAQAPPAVAPPAPPTAGTAAAPAAEAAPAEEKISEDAYIETPRCTTCEECVQINNKMFAYDGNKQAFIADIGAGTYRQLVEAAEACQVSIIHPGKPRNAGEPGIEELLERASGFR